ncbi:hypothetical protein AVEN_71403-1 [Araneus ventricosus]|uniref:Integrase catalytic domain-containing protein n=1 Tax=Araneus ventricosus TaxID=182803 RepID=A0A4Y2BI69_ARAVE|nr:hypothetical protein AVEN_71403-1 [Araneus ventricosus]
MACCIGTRLAPLIKLAFDLPGIPITFWRDLMSALRWIREHGEWSVFVSNRIKEIRRRFVARISRHRVVFSDNGTNFRGAYKCLREIDWNKVAKEAGIFRITCKFNPPTVAWWGGRGRGLLEL